MKSTGNRILAWALGGSLVAHLIFALVVHSMPEVQAHEQPLGHTTIDFVKHTPPPPTPTPPPPKHPAHPAPSAHPARPTVHPPKALPGAKSPGKGIGPVVIATAAPGGGSDPDPGPTGSPEPTATPRPACSNPNVAAQAVDPISPPVPDDAAGASGVAQVRVTLTPTGGVSDVGIYRSTGNLFLDRAAIRAARGSSYRPEIRDCTAVGGTYLFTVDFQS